MHHHKQSEGDLLPAVVRKRSPEGGLLNTVERFSKRGFLLVFSVRLTSYWESYSTSICARGVRSKLKLGGGGSSFQGHFFIKKRAPSRKFTYGGYTTQLSLKLLNSECL